MRGRGPTIPDAHVLAKTLLGTLEVDYPFVRRQADDRARVGRHGLCQPGREARRTSTLTRDRLRVGFLRLGFDALSDRFLRSGFLARRAAVARQRALLELRQGLAHLRRHDDCGPTGADCLGPAIVPPSRLEGQSDATVLRYTAYGELRPIPKLTFALGARAQYAWKPLLSFEEFSAGNYTVGRGYDPGALLGDEGFGTQAEIRFGSRIPTSAASPAIEGYAFWDHAVGPQPRPAGRCRRLRKHLELDRRRRAGQFRPLRARRRARRPADPRRDSTTGSPTHACSFRSRPGCGHGATDDHRSVRHYRAA